MSYAGARALAAADLAAVTWAVPASCSGIGALQKTRFDADAIFTASEPPTKLKPSLFPIATIFIAAISETRKVSGSDLVSYKIQLVVPTITVHMVVKEENLSAGTDYFDAMMDGILAYFRQHSGGGATPTLGTNDRSIAVGLEQRANQSRPVLEQAWYKFQGTIQPTFQMGIV